MNLFLNLFKVNNKDNGFRTSGFVILSLVLTLNNLTQLENLFKVNNKDNKLRQLALLYCI